MAQKRNPQNEELLSAHMARRDEPNFALGNAISSYLALPALRAFWPTSAHHVTTQAWCLDDIACDYDVYAHGSLHLGFSVSDLWIYLDGDKYFYYPNDAQFDIRGIDPPTTIVNRGLTLGAWAKFDNIGANEALLSKYDTTGNNRSYYLGKDILNRAYMKISFDGANINIDALASTSTMVANTWYFIVGRWDATNISIMLDSQIKSAASTQASIFNSAAEFDIGRLAYGAWYMTGYQSFIFICSSSVSDSILRNIWHQTRYLFNK